MYQNLISIKKGQQFRTDPLTTAQAVGYVQYLYSLIETVVMKGNNPVVKVLILSKSNFVSFLVNIIY